MNLTPLKYILFIENVTTVFRNYLCLKRRTRIIVFFWVIIEAFINSFTAVDTFTPDRKFKSGLIYFVLSVGFSIYLLIASLYYSKRFYRVLVNFDAFHKIFDDGVYYQKMLKAQKVLTIKAISLCCLLAFMFTYFRLPTSAGSKGWVMTIISLYCKSISDIRFIFQYFVLHCIFFVVSEQLKVITRSLDGELSAIRDSRRNVEHAENLSCVASKYAKLNKCVKAYENINDSSNLSNSIFSVQLTIMLLTVTAYYIILMYTIISIITVKGPTTWTVQLMNAIAMVVFLSALLQISRAGQQIQNNYVELRQTLCELCVHTLEHEKYYKLTKDLLRYVRTRPVRVNLFGIVDIDMSMLPSIIAFFTSYTVIALQFTNVL